METTDIRASDADAAVGQVLRRGLALVGTYVRVHPLPFSIAVGGAALYAGMTVATSVVLGRVTDRLITPAFAAGAGPGHHVDGGTVVGAMALIMGIALLRALGISMRRFFAGMFVGRTQATLRTQVVEHYQQLPLSFHRSRPAGELLAHAEADVDAATELLHPLPYSTAVLLIIVIATIALVATDWVLALVGLALIPLLGMCNLLFTRKLEPLARQAQEQVGAVSRVAHESFDGALVVKTLGLEDSEVHRFDVAAARLRDHRIGMGRVRSTFGPVVDTLPGLATVALLALGAWRLSTGAVTTGVLVQFASLFSLLTGPLRVISYLLFDFPKSLVGYARVKEVLDVPLPTRGEREPAADVALPPGKLSVAVQDLSFRYADAPVLESVTWDVAPGSTVAVVGATGAGKSTLVQLLGGLLEPQGGRVEVAGIDLRHLEPEAVRRDVALVFQESFLFATSVHDNIALGLPGITDADIEAAARLAQAHRFITRLPQGYGTVMGERGVTLSGGQRQRVALARALVRRPRVLVLDDATSAVDPTVEARILQGLRTDLAATVVVVASRTSTIALADHVVFLADGRVAAAGTHRELLASVPAYEQMVRAYELAAAAAAAEDDG